MMFKTKLLITSALAALVLPARCGALDGVLDSIDDLPEDLKAEYTQGADGKYVLQVKGMKSQADFDRVQGALTKERGEHSALKTRIKENFGDEKFEDIHAKLDRIPELEAAAEGKMDDEKLTQIVEGRLKTRIAPIERERDGYKAQVTELGGTITELTNEKTKRTIRDAVRKAAREAKVTDEAIDDALLLGDTLFEVREDDGKVVVKADAGYTQGIEPSVLFTDLQAKKPHWFGESSGGGAGGNRGGGGGGANNPFTAEHWNMTEQGRIMTTNPSKAEQLAKAAGHKDAATAVKPAPKK